MLYFIYILYASVLSFFFWKATRKFNINNKLRYLILAAKLLACLAMVYIPLHYMTSGNDYYFYFRMGLRELEILQNNPALFFSDFGQHNYNELGEVFSAENSFWDDLAGNVLLKTLALVSFVCFKNFYITTLVFGFAGLTGSLYFFKYFIGFFPSHKNLVAAGSFLLPSTLLFTSGIHKDTLIFISLAALLNFGNRIINGKKVVWDIIYFCAFFLLLFALRNYVAVLFLVAFSTLLVWRLTKWRYIYICLGLVLAGFISFTVVSMISPAHSPYKILIQRQESFRKLKTAHTQIEMPQMEPSTISIVKALPRAVDNVLLRPYPWQFYNFSLSIMATEMWLYLALFLWAVFLFFNRKSFRPTPQLLWSWLLGILAFLIIGYIVSNSGTAVRYRAIYLPIFIIPVIILIRKNLSYKIK